MEKHNSREANYNLSSNERNTKSILNIFHLEYDYPYILILVILFITAFRPDRLIPGGRILTHVPTIIVVTLFIYWLISNDKYLSDRRILLYFILISFMIIQLPFVRNFGLAQIIVKSELIYGITYFLVKTSFINQFEKISKFIKLSTGLFIFIAFLGITGLGKVNIPILYDENDFALFMNILIPFSFFLAQDARNIKEKLFWYGCTLLFVMANITTVSRGGFVGFVAVVVYLFLKSKKKLVTVMLLIMIGLAVIPFAPEKFQSEIESILDDPAGKGTGKERVESWKAGWKMFIDNPVMGVGPLNYGVHVGMYYNEYGAKTRKHMWGRVAHSIYFTLLPELGLFGVIIFSLVFIQNIKTHRYIANLRNKKDKLLKKIQSDDDKEVDLLKKKIDTLYYFSAANMGSFIGYLVSGIFLSVLYYHYFWSITAIWVILLRITKKIENSIKLNCQLACNE